MFAAFDFVIFGIFLALSVLVGIYHGLKASFTRFTHSQASEYISGGHNLPVLPVCLSLITTFVSGIALLGVPAEIYMRGRRFFVVVHVANRRYYLFIYSSSFAGASMGAAYLLGSVAFIVVGKFCIRFYLV